MSEVSKTRDLRYPLPSPSACERWCPLLRELEHLEGESEPMIEHFRQLAGGLWLLDLLNERLGPHLGSFEEKLLRDYRSINRFLP